MTVTASKTNRLRLFLYTSVEDYEEGDATRSVLVTGDMELGRVMLDFVQRHTADVYLFEVVKNPEY